MSEQIFSRCSMLKDCVVKYFLNSNPNALSLTEGFFSAASYLA